MFDDREAMFDEREAKFDFRVCLGVGGGVPLHYLVICETDFRLSQAGTIRSKHANFLETKMD